MSDIADQVRTIADPPAPIICRYKDGELVGTLHFRDGEWEMDYASEAPAGRVPRRLLSQGFVYFIRAGRMRAVKIGWAKDAEARLAALQTASHHRLHLIGFHPGSHADEQEWHDRFRHLRIRGEWFNLTDELRQAINDTLFHAEGAVAYSRLSLDAVRAEARRFAVAHSTAHSVHGQFRPT